MAEYTDFFFWLGKDGEVSELSAEEFELQFRRNRWDEWVDKFIAYGYDNLMKDKNVKSK